MHQDIEDAGLSNLVEIRLGDAIQTLSAVESAIDFLFLDGAKEHYSQRKVVLNKDGIQRTDNQISQQPQHSQPLNAYYS